jgi:hypothetical protein
MRELEPGIEDLIGKGEETIEVDEGSLCFRWRQELKKYKELDN